MFQADPPNKAGRKAKKPARKTETKVVNGFKPTHPTRQAGSRPKQLGAAECSARVSSRPTQQGRPEALCAAAVVNGVNVILGFQADPPNKAGRK